MAIKPSGENLMNTYNNQMTLHGVLPAMPFPAGRIVGGYQPTVGLGNYNPGSIPGMSGSPGGFGMSFGQMGQMLGTHGVWYGRPTIQGVQKW